jgi:hypothetical protein
VGEDHLHCTGGLLLAVMPRWWVQNQNISSKVIRENLCW